MTRVFHNRSEAGRALAEKLESLRGDDIVVLGLPRGGVPVAFEVAMHLEAPLDVIVVRKVGVPGHAELAMGAIGEDGVRVVNHDVVDAMRVSDADFALVEARERDELDRRAARFRKHAARAPIDGRTALIVDDGIATGSTARAACQVARAHGAARVVLAVPVAAPDSVAALRDDADDIVCVEQPAWLQAVGQWYRDFTQVDDDTVIDLLEQARRRDLRRTPPAQNPDGSRIDAEVHIDVGGIVLPGHLTVPTDACGVVIFAHGSGSSRHSPRNTYVADRLNAAGLGTLTFDLLTDDEARDRRNVFDIDLLATRLAKTAQWVRQSVGDLPIALFGASTGAAAALVAADDPPVPIAAVVSRGGRPDLAGEHLEQVIAPTLLIVGGADTAVLELNRQAQRRLRGTQRLSIVPGATHLFEEPGTLDAAASLAADWFVEHCRKAPRGTS